VRSVRTVRARGIGGRSAAPLRTARRTSFKSASAATALAVVTGLALTALPGAAGAAPHAERSGPNGPVGWDTYRRLDRLSQLPDGVRTRQFSSFDRTGGNDDGFKGTHSCLRKEPGSGRCVLAEDSGAGEVGAIWFTRDNGDVTKTGDISVELDGRKVLDAPLQDVVDGKVGAPFVHPLVADAEQSSGGVYIEVPMPYRKSMKITTEHNPLFYHVSQRSFPSADGVRTFDPSDPARDVLARLRAAGTRDPKPALPGARTRRTALHVPAGESRTLASTDLPGLLTGLRLRLPQAKPAAPKLVTDDGRAFKDQKGGGGEKNDKKDETGASAFTVAIDPHNKGVRLTRRLDPSVGKQTAEVTVDGKPAGRWEPNEQSSGTWSKESITLPASVTAGKSTIRVRNRFVSSDLDFNEFRYDVDSVAEDGGTHRTDSVDVGDAGAEQAHDYAISGENWHGEHRFAFPLDSRDRDQLAAAQRLLKNLRLRISFDGERTVDAPVGEFFGSGQALAPVRSLMSGIDPDTARFDSWWPMPFAHRATVQLHNGGSTDVTTGEAAVTSAPSRAQAAAVRAGTAGHFRATSHAGRTEDGKSWSFLKASGRGKFVGVSHSMAGRLDRNFLEGDERAYVDGSRSPAVHGTGTEDFYQSGWYFNHETYSEPWNGNPTHLGPRTGCTDTQDCTGAYRQLLHDSVAFDSSLDYSIEHGFVNDVPGDYSSTAYWYGAASANSRTHGGGRAHGARADDTLTVGDADSEQAHGYTSPDPGPVRSLDSDFEGDFRHPLHLTADTRATRSPVRFTLAVDPRNRGVELRRTGDQSEAGQRADVTVNGHRLPEWREPLGNTGRRWLDDSYRLPASLTHGKSKITVTLRPRRGAPAWSAGAYRTYSAHTER